MTAVRRKRLVVGVGATALVLLAVCCVVGACLVKRHVLGRLYNDLVLDNRDHFLPCDSSPPLRRSAWFWWNTRTLWRPSKRSTQGSCSWR
jgi:hypothetical protein